jgi:hypothetical protein
MSVCLSSWEARRPGGLPWGDLDTQVPLGTEERAEGAS